jgi:hypothetical protein
MTHTLAAGSEPPVNASAIEIFERLEGVRFGHSSRALERFLAQHPLGHARLAFRSSRSRERSSALLRSIARENAEALIAPAWASRYRETSSG